MFTGYQGYDLNGKEQLISMKRSWVEENQQREPL